MNKKTKNILPRFLTIFALFVVLIIPHISMAVDESEAEAEACVESKILPPCTCDGNCRLEDMLVLGVNIFQMAISLLGAVSVGFIILAGIMMMTSGGSSQRLEMGKKILSGSFVGTAIVMMTWLIINTIYFFAAGGNGTVFGKNWFDLKEYPPIEIIPAVYISDDQGNEVLVTPECSDLKTVAAAYGVPYPRQNSPEVERLKTCIQTNITWSLVDTDQIFTYDVSHDSCNYTRGKPVCETSGKCSHSSKKRPSCHYGGTSGSNGAEAIDYNARDNSLHGETILYNQIKAAVDGPCNSLVGYDLFEIYKKADGSYNHAHTHLSTTACDGN
ncbi:MAG: pilin [Patescibacteria group bacterium]